MQSWIEHENVKAVLLAHLPGQESGNSLVDILYGDVNPSGRLPYTIGKSIQDYGPTAGILEKPNGIIPQADFTEGLYIDYRYFDKNEISPRYDFGFGLSYTTFEFSGIVITMSLAPTEFPPPRPDSVPAPILNSTIPNPEEMGYPQNIVPVNGFVYPFLTDPSAVKTSPPYPYPTGYSTDTHTLSPAGGGQGGHPALYDTIFHVSITVTNTGSVPGKAVAQLYLSFPAVANVDFPTRVLRGFEKVGIGLGESIQVEFDLTRRDLSYWDEKSANWRIPLSEDGSIGSYGIFVGESSRGEGVGGKTDTVIVR